MNVTQDCPLCAIFIQATSVSFGAKGGKPILMVHRASDYFNFRVDKQPDFVILGIGQRDDKDSAVYPRSLLLPTDANQSRPKGRVISNQIDWRVVRDWLNICDTQHALGCRSKLEEIMTGLRFIDCENLEIVPSPETPPPYMTLSYVWARAGHSIGHNVQQGHLSGNIPLIVEDAIRVVKVLGYRYLWVDRYCVPQEDGHEKSTLINNMDRIYRCSILNLIANGEQGSHYGLPGVSSVPRTTQHTMRIGSREYSLCMLDTWEKVKQSEWNKRGWTYQEGLLSRRKLVFTDTQLYFQCNQLICMEMIFIPHFSIPSFTESEAYSSWKVFPSYQHDDGSSLGFNARIAEYRIRSLTYKSDRYKAFQGILNSFFQIKFPQKNLYGLPLLRDSKDMSNSTLMLISLCWGSTEHASRNSIFPSWTWLGWEVTFPSQSVSEVNTFFRVPSKFDYCFPISIFMEFDDGTSMQWPGEYDKILWRSVTKGPPPYLEIYGAVFDVDLSIRKGQHQSGAHRPKIRVSPLPKGWSNGDAYFDSPEAGCLGGITRCIGLLMLHGYEPILDKSYTVRVLYLTSKGPSTYERIGVGILQVPWNLTDGLTKNPTTIKGLKKIRMQRFKLV